MSLAFNVTSRMYGRAPRAGDVRKSLTVGICPRCRCPPRPSPILRTGSIEKAQRGGWVIAVVVEKDEDTMSTAAELALDKLVTVAMFVRLTISGRFRSRDVLSRELAPDVELEGASPAGSVVPASSTRIVVDADEEVHRARVSR